MSRQLEAKREERQAKLDRAVLLALDGGLYEAVGHAGGDLTGLAVRYRGEDVLVVVKAEFPAGPQVAFVGAMDLAACLVKAMREANQDKLRWREDRYAGPG